MIMIVAEKITKSIVNMFKAIDNVRNVIKSETNLSIKLKNTLLKELDDDWKEMEKRIGQSNLTMRDVMNFEKLNNKKTDIPQKQLNQFIDLFNDMSPENLSWDGERSPREQKLALQKLQQAWKKLEREVGRKVSTTEIYKYITGL